MTNGGIKKAEPSGSAFWDVKTQCVTLFFNQFLNHFVPILQGDKNKI